MNTIVANDWNRRSRPDPLISRLRGLVSITALSLALAACGDDDHERAHLQDAELVQTARQVLDAHRDRHEFPGAVIALHDPARGNALVTSGFARPSGDAAPVDPDVPWVIGSVTKTFIAVSVLQLAEEGEIDLDGSIEPFFPGLPAASKITTRQLLQHTSGLNEYTDAPSVLVDLLRAWTPQELIAVAVDRGPLGEPGASHHYSNTNYIVLGELLSKVTDRLWYEVVRERVLEPLGMHHTHYAGESDAPPVGYGHHIEDGRLVDFTLRVHPSVGGAAGALQSTAPDLLRFARALHDGRLLAEESRQQMQAFIAAEPIGYIGHEYGLGFERYTLNELVLCGHVGEAPAHASFIGFDPDTDLVVAVITNTADAQAPALMAAETVGALTNQDVGPPRRE